MGDNQGDVLLPASAVRSIITNAQAQIGVLSEQLRALSSIVETRKGPSNTLWLTGLPGETGHCQQDAVGVSSTGSSELRPLGEQHATEIPSYDAHVDLHTASSDSAHDSGAAVSGAEGGAFPSSTSEFFPVPPDHALPADPSLRCALLGAVGTGASPDAVHGLITAGEDVNEADAVRSACSLTQATPGSNESF
jgi:hypothetical protein